MFSQQPNMGERKQFYDLIIDEDNNENEKELNETDYNDSSSNEEEERLILNLSSENAEEANNKTIVEEAVEVVPEEVNRRETRSTILREQVNKNQDNSADKMVKKHDHKRNKKTQEFDVGTSISIKIPKVDVGGTEFPRLAAVIKEKKHDKYLCVCAYGILDVLFRAGDLEPYHGL